MAVSIKIDPQNMRVAFDGLKRDVLMRVAKAVQVEQLGQVAQAFRDEGQPGDPWPKLWADTFVGKVPWKAQGALINAQSAFFKATNSKKPDAARIAKAMSRVEKARAKAIPATSYRKGGKILQDNGWLKASFFPSLIDVEGDKATSRIFSSMFYALWHQKGFKTKGPNFIPLTLKARRMHKLGANPKDEGLEEGVDYVMKWRGVKVPQRKMIDYANATNKELIKRAAIYGAKRK